MTDAFFLPHPVNPVHPVEKSSERIKGGSNKRRLSIAEEKHKVSWMSPTFRVPIYLHSPFCRLCERLSQTFRTHQRTLFQDAPLPRAVTIPIVFLDDLDPLAYTETINHLEDACEINSDY